MFGPFLPTALIAAPADLPALVKKKGPLVLNHDIFLEI